MENYSMMLKGNQERSDAMLSLSLNIISEMLIDGEKITIAELVRRTGFSRAYFYKNPEVSAALKNAITSQTGKVFSDKKNGVLLRAQDREIELLKQKNAALQRQVIELQKQLEKKSSQEFDFVNNL